MLHTLLFSLALSFLAPTVTAQSTPDCPSGIETCGKGKSPHHYLRLYTYKNLGYVWREAYGRDDHICVSPASRTQAVEDNAQAGRRREPNSDNCKPGFVWREAAQSNTHKHDHVCVTPTTKAQVMEDNKKHSIRLNQECLRRSNYPLGPLLGVVKASPRQPPIARRHDLDIAKEEIIASPCTYGEDTCLQGYVWREGSPPNSRLPFSVTDRVCVTSAIRAQTANDNSQAAACREPNGGRYGPDACRQGHVWREAVLYPHRYVSDDHVYVTPATRAQAKADNEANARSDW
jgi:hypothetical protein